MTIDEAKKYISGKARQNQVGHIPTDILNVYFERAQLEVVDELWGSRREYQPGRAVPTTGGFERNQTIADELRTLLVTNEAPLNASQGLGLRLNIPTDFLHLASMQTFFIKNSPTGSESRWTNVKMVTHAEYGDYLDSQIVFPTYKTPIAIQNSDNWEIAPNNVSRSKVVYVRKPVAPIWAFTNVSGQQVFDAGNSVDFELPETVHNEICEKVLGYIGISTRDTELYSGSQNQEQKGV